MSIKVYTDGACRGNPGPGGWGVYIINGNQTEELYAGDPLQPIIKWKCRLQSAP